MNQFLPVTKVDLTEWGWKEFDFLVIVGDAYVDHPSFGPVTISRMLEAESYRMAILAQPDQRRTSSFTALGRPRLGVLLSSGNIDSMVVHYTVARKRRHDDAYSPGNRVGLRPNQAVIVYANKVREAFGDIPLVIGGLEAGLRHFAHYDHWEDKVRRAVFFDSQADLLIYDMGERATREIVVRLASGTPIRKITDVKGTAFIAKDPSACAYPKVECPSFEAVSTDKRTYAQANQIQYEEHGPVRGKAILQRHGDRLLVVSPPAIPLTATELGFMAELPYVREPHLMYDEMGGVPAIEEVCFSVTHDRGCFGAYNFCSLAFHRGQTITSHSHGSVLREVEALTRHPGFKGYIHDVGGPTANFCRPACKKQMKAGMCRGRACLAPMPCPNLGADHTDYLMLLCKVRQVPGVRKVFIRSGTCFDYMLQDKSGELFAELVKYHVSDQLKVAPEHYVSDVLDYMGKPHIEIYERFKGKYERLNRKYGKEQYLVSCLMSSHPDYTLDDAVRLTEWISRTGRQPEQVQDFYPTPGTLSARMYHTGIDPRIMQPVHVPRDLHEKAIQRALMQWKRPEKRPPMREALYRAHRKDLIGYGKGCPLWPDGPAKPGGQLSGQGKPAPAKDEAQPTRSRPAEKVGWATAKPEKDARPKKKK